MIKKKSSLNLRHPRNLREIPTKLYKRNQRHPRDLRENLRNSAPLREKSS